MGFSVEVAQVKASLGSVMIYLTLSSFRKRRNQSSMSKSQSGKCRQAIVGSGDM